MIDDESQSIDDKIKQQFFVGCTRARSNLFLFCRDKIPNLFNNNLFSDTYTRQDNRIPIKEKIDENDLPF